MNRFEEIDRLLYEIKENQETIATLRRQRAALRTRLLDVAVMLRAGRSTTDDRERLAGRIEDSLNTGDLDA